jgi:serine/threonine-protein phosphatase PP1-1
MTLLLCLKLLYPERVTLLCGNHESREMTRPYGFAAESKSEFGKQIYRLFCQTFNRLALCAVVDNPVL